MSNTLPKHLIQLTDDIYQLHIPLPYLLNRVNVYLIQGDHGWSIVDTGLNQPESRAVWLSTFEALNIQPYDIEQIILTHTHPDHYGMAGWLQSTFASNNPPVKMSPIETNQAQVIWVESEGRYDLISEQMWLSGAPNHLEAVIIDGIRETRRMTLPHPAHTELIEPNSAIRIGNRIFQAIHAPGHSDGQLIFYDAVDKLMLSGDQILQKITPNIGLWVTGDAHPLRHYLASLRELHAFDVRLALPGHKTLIEDWRGRIDEIAHHHDERLNQVLDAVERYSSAYDVAAAIFDLSRLTNHEIRFALVESLSHLEYLREENQLKREDAPNAIWRYTRA